MNQLRRAAWVESLESRQLLASTLQISLDAASASAIPFSVTTGGNISWVGQYLASKPASIWQPLHDLGIDALRTHDIPAIDWAEIFPDWGADPLLPSSYHFADADPTMQAMVNAGFVPFLRIGTNWDNDHPNGHEPATNPPDAGKWAQIAERIVAHYVDGWNGGYAMPIQYVEIWNEPDSSMFWTGTPQHFQDLAKQSLRLIKQTHPQLQVGGPGLAYDFGGGYGTGLVAYLANPGDGLGRVPLDFFSWHNYEGGNGAVSLMNAAGTARNALDQYGYESALSICTEWNADLPEGYGSTPPGYVSTPIKAAADVASSLIAAEATHALDSMFFYPLVENAWGMFHLDADNNLVPTKMALAMEAFHDLRRATPIRVPTTGSLGAPGPVALAGRSTDGRMLQILLSDQASATTQINLIVRGLNGQSSVQVDYLLLDANHDLTSIVSAAATVTNGQVVLSPPSWTSPATMLVRVTLPTPIHAYGSERGLTASYFSNTSLAGAPVATRIDPNVDFGWSSATRPQGIAGSNFSVRWTGRIVPRYSETYTFTTTSDDGVRLWVNGRQLVENWTGHGATEDSGSIAMIAGVPVNITMDYFQGIWATAARLDWQSASQPRETVPQSQLLPSAPLPAGWSDTDPGTPAFPGWAGYDPGSGTWTLGGSGADIWGTSDQFHFASTAMSADGEIIAHVDGVTNTATWAKAGVMLRGSSSADAPFAAVIQIPDNEVAFQYRTTTGASAQGTVSVGGTASAKWVRLVRGGDSVSGYYATTAGTPTSGDWVQIGSPVTISMPNVIRAGLAVTSHNNAAIATATFTNVSVNDSVPAVQSFSINGGATQRSMVKQFNLVFSEPVTLASGLGLRLHGGAAVASVTLVPSSADRQTYTITFSGSAVIGGSLPDGIYDLTLTGSAMADDTSNTVVGNSTWTFHRLFGDSDGNKVVNALDYARLKNTFARSSSDPLFNGAFDYEGNNLINALDLARFRQRYGLVYSY